MTKNVLLYAGIAVATLGSNAIFAEAAHAASIGSPGDAKQVTRTIKIIAADDLRFHPAKIAVRRGETVRLIIRNAGKIDHELVLGTTQELAEHAELMREFPGMEHDEPNEVSVHPGETRVLVWRFPRSGTVNFACLIPGHFEAGMKGKFTVGAH